MGGVERFYFLVHSVEKNVEKTKLSTENYPRIVEKRKILFPDYFSRILLIISSMRSFRLEFILILYSTRSMAW